MKFWPLVEAGLTPRQKQVAVGLMRGLSDKEIGKELNISPQTVKYYVCALVAKFDVPTWLHQRICLAVKLTGYLAQ